MGVRDWSAPPDGTLSDEEWRCACQRGTEKRRPDPNPRAAEAGCGHRHNRNAQGASAPDGRNRGGARTAGQPRRLRVVVWTEADAQVQGVLTPGLATVRGQTDGRHRRMNDDWATWDGPKLDTGALEGKDRPLTGAFRSARGWVIASRIGASVWWAGALGTCVRPGRVATGGGRA